MIGKDNWIGRRQETPIRRPPPATTPRKSLLQRTLAKRRDTAAAKPVESSKIRVQHNFHLRAMVRAWRRFQEGSLSHWTTTVIIALSLTIFGSFALLLTNVEAVMAKWRIDNTLTIFLDRHVKKDDIQTIRRKLNEIPGIAAIDETDPTNAMLRLKKMIGQEAAFLDDLDENPLPYTMEILLVEEDIARAATIATNIQTWRGVESVVYDRKWLERLSAIMHSMRRLGFIFSGLLLVAVALIISNTIKLTIIARRDEVEVMRFMGATDGFIKIPFLYEGILQGLLGALLAVLLMGLLNLSAHPVLTELETSFGFQLHWHFLPIIHLVGLVFLGILLGLSGSLLAVTRFLEV